MAMRWGWMLTAGVLLAGCGGAPRVKTASGLEYQELKKGTGPEAKARQTVSVHYTGWLENGSVIDDSRQRGLPFEFILGQNQVIPGMNEGVTGMRVGGKRKLYVPPKLGYGDAGTPNGKIPPKAALTYEVELLEIKG